MKLAPSILSADFADLAKALSQCKEGGAEYIHVDVMDGHFVPNITIGPCVVKDLNRRGDIPLDVHLMIENPDKFIKEFVEAGSHIITVHVETCPHLHRTIQLIKNEGALAGIALNPATPINSIEHVLDEVDLILLMSVNPGFGGQKFISFILNKITKLDKLLKKQGRRESILIEVDGGIKLDNAGDVLKAGADVLVAGSAVFNTDNPSESIKKFYSIGV